MAESNHKPFVILKEDGDLRIPKKMSDDIRAGKALKIIIRQGCSPGDILTLTAAVRDLKLAYPKLLINPKTSCHEIWHNNKHITDFPEPLADIDVYVHYNLVHNSNNAARHMIHAFREDMEVRLDIPIPLTKFKCDIHLSKLEGANQAAEMFDLKGRFWLVNAGYKSDYPLKAWKFDYWQEVIDRLKDKIIFVQVGAVSEEGAETTHYHAPLEGVHNMIGFTNLRQLIRLAKQADGAVGHVSMLNHLMSVWSKPSVVIAGGREAAGWEAYNETAYLDTIGTMSCCWDYGCWKSRKGDCPHIIDEYPKCMHIIKPDDVVRAIEKYYDGGRLKYPKC